MPKLNVVQKSVDKKVDIRSIAVGDLFEDMYEDVYIKTFEVLYPGDTKDTYDAVRLSDGKLHKKWTAGTEMVYPIDATMTYTRVKSVEEAGDEK